IARVAHRMDPLSAAPGAVVAGIDVDGVAGGLLAQEVPAAIAGAYELHQKRVVVVILAVEPVHSPLAPLIAEVQHPELPPLLPVAQIAAVDLLADLFILREPA